MYKEKFFAKSVRIAEETDRIIEVAEKLGMVLPSTHTALFQSVYAPLEEANLNGVRLATDAVEKALPGLISAQSNLEHLGQGFMTGIILDTWINDSNEIEIIFSFAKNLYPDEYERAVELMKTGDLSVSFELLAEVDAQEKLPDGTILLHEIDFQGVGVLLDNPPAYPDAKVYQFAKQCKERLSKIPERELICASQVAEKCDKILSEEQTDNVDEPNIFLVTSTDDDHSHIAEIDRDGNGHTISTMGTDGAVHIHEVMNYQIQKSDKHAHQIRDEIIAKIKEYVKLKADKWTSDIYNNFPNSSFAVIEPAFLDGETGNHLARHLAFKDRDGRVDLTNYRIALDRVDELLPITDSITTEELRKQAKEELAKYTDKLTNVIEGTHEQGGNKNVTEEQKTKIEAIRAELGDLVKDISDKDLLDDNIVAKIREDKSAIEEAEAKAKVEAEEADAKAKTEADEAEASEKEVAFKRDMVEVRTFSVEEVDGVETVIENVQTITVTEWNAMQEASAKLAELEASMESVVANTEAIVRAKISLEGNEFAKDFTDEDYLSEEKITKAVQDKNDAEKVATLKEELKDNKYAKDFSDEDYLNEDKVELAKLKAKLPAEELNASEEEKPEPEEDMETGTPEAEAKEHQEVLASIRKTNNDNRGSQTIYERK